MANNVTNNRASTVITIKTPGPQGPKGNIGPIGPTSDTGSLLTTASILNDTVTFTKGDSSTFDIIIDNISSSISSSYADVAALANSIRANDINQDRPFDIINAISGSFLYITASTIEVDANTIKIGGEELSRVDVQNLKNSKAEFDTLKERPLLSSSAQLDALGYIKDNCCDDFRIYTQSNDLRYNAISNYAVSLSSSHDALENLVEGLLEATSSYLTVANSTPTLQQVTSVGSTTTSSLTIANTFVSGNLSVEKTSQYPTGTNINGEVLNIKGTTIFETGLSEEDNLIGNVADVNNTGIYGGTSYFYKKRDNLDAYFFLGGAALLTVNRNSGLYTTTITGCTNFPVLPWDRKINNYFIKNNLVAATDYFANNVGGSSGVNHSIFMPPILNAGYSAGEVVQVYNMTSSSLEGERYDPILLNSGSIYITAFSNLVTAVNTEEKLVTAIGNQNQGIYSGSWNNYTNIVWINTGSFYNMDKSIEVPPGYKAVFEVFHYGTPSSYYNITHPHPNNIAYQYGYKYSGYNTSVTSGIGSETSKVYRLIGVEPL